MIKPTTTSKFERPLYIRGWLVLIPSGYIVGDENIMYDSEGLCIRRSNL